MKRATLITVIAAAVIGLALIGMAIWNTLILSDRHWCATAMGAEKLAAQTNVDAMKACIGLLTLQLKALAWNSHINVATLALCLLALIVVAIAGARFSGEFAGGRINMGRAVPVKVENSDDDPIPVEPKP